MYVQGYLQGSENGRVVTIDLYLVQTKYKFLLILSLNDING
jgi:hypothetical protein